MYDIARLIYTMYKNTLILSDDLISFRSVTVANGNVYNNQYSYAVKEKKIRENAPYIFNLRTMY